MGYFFNFLSDFPCGKILLMLSMMEAFFFSATPFRSCSTSFLVSFGLYSKSFWVWNLLSATSFVMLQLAMMARRTTRAYANARSLKDGLKPYYIFSDTIAYKQKILSKGSYIIGYFDFDLQENDFVKVTVDFSSDGYRLPFYDEWMMFARGGDKKNIAPWGDESADIKEVQKYALFDKWEHYYESEPVGQLTPNGYGLYDFFGLVWEHVLFEEINPFLALQGRPSCAKGGDNHVTF